MEPVRPPVEIIVLFNEPFAPSVTPIAPGLSAESYSIVTVHPSPHDPRASRSLNDVISAAVSAKHDVIVLCSGVVVSPGVISELSRVAYLDPMTGFVSPRSDDPTISFLAQPALSKHLPEYHYVPSAASCCLYIKYEVLEEFGLPDEIYSSRRHSQDDLIMRANRAGYRAVLANRAFVYHSPGGAALASIEKADSDLLDKRYPEFAASVANYLAGAHYEGERMLTALLPDSDGRLDLSFDFSSVEPYYNGTFEAAKRILKCALEKWRPFFSIYVMVSDEVARFHRLDELPNVRLVPLDTKRVFAVSFRFGQPFQYSQLIRMSRAAVLNVYDMLDPIALDCLYLNNADLPLIWASVFQHADAVLYLSDFVAQQFRRRFRFGPRLKELVAYLSLDLRDYAPAETPAAGSGEYILVIGNSFLHKHVPTTVDALSKAFPREKIVAFGLDSMDRPNVTTCVSGNLSDDKMRDLLGRAKFVVFPSLYEGFGIPILESLAHSKPVLARSIPVVRDIRQRIHGADNLILYTSTKDLIARLNEGFPVWKPPIAPSSPNADSDSWEAVTSRIGEFIRSLLDDWSFSDNLVPRLEHMRLLQEKERLASASAANIEGLNQALRSVSGLLRDRDARIADIYNSFSWKLTAPLRWLGGVLRIFRS